MESRMKPSDADAERLWSAYCVRGSAHAIALGVEPFPRSWSKHRLLKLVGSSTFHADHHQESRVKFGFYTTVCDRVFGTYGR